MRLDEPHESVVDLLIDGKEVRLSMRTVTVSVEARLKISSSPRTLRSL
jgi:hypothetical protein